MTARHRIVLADDHEIVRQGIKRLIDEQPDMVVVGEASDGVAAVKQVVDLQPDVIVLDLSMPGASGLVAASALRSARPETAIVVLTRHPEEAYLEEMLRAGAAGYVLKQSPSHEFLQAIRTAVAGGRYLDSAMTRQVAEELENLRPSDLGRPPSLPSRRQREVLRLVAIGFSNKEIAARLGLSVKTVEAHKSGAARKLGLRGRVDIVRYAEMQGWLHDT